MSDVCPGCGEPVRDGEAAYCGSVPHWHWNCHEAALARGRPAQLRRQIEETQRALALYEAYARSIGCRVVGDVVECDADQAKLLSRWWNKKK